MTPTTRNGHPATLLACFLHFDLCFMLWVLLGALGVFIGEALQLSPAEKGLMVAIPVLGGSLLRLPIGILSDRIGGKRVGLALLAFLFLPLALGWQQPTSFSMVLLIGLLLGAAGSSFAVALPLASRWYPPERQGLVMGIAAAGNSGTVLANLIAPRLAMRYGWPEVFGLAMVPLALVFIVFLVLAKENPSAAPPSTGALVRLLRKPDAWWVCFFYLVTFGGYVGLSSFLPIFLRDQYQVSPIVAGNLTALAALVGSVVRPVGGYLADRIGGLRMLSIVFSVIGVAYALCAQLPPLSLMLPLLIAAMIALGLGNGAVFQVVPQRFAESIGAATGLVGALGGVGGFMVPLLLGQLKQQTGTFAAGFIVLGFVALAAVTTLQLLSARHRQWCLCWAADEHA